MKHTNTHGRAISHKRRELQGRAVDMAMVLLERANINDRSSCRRALTAEGFPIRTIEIMLDVVMELASKVEVKKLPKRDEA
jgi:hypothetical protein